jgi:hypothetical protein
MAQRFMMHLKIVAICSATRVTGRGQRVTQKCRRAGTRLGSCEVLTAVTMENVVFWDIETQFVPHGRHISSALGTTANDSCHPDDGGARLLRNVGSYKNHTA